jgi:glycosyltransferase involved in cell wall biosynthesis
MSASPAVPGAPGDHRLVILESYPHLRGGAQRVNHALAVGLPGLGWRCEVIAPGGGPAVDALRDDGVPVVQLAAGPSLLRYGQPRPSPQLALDLGRWWREVARHLRQRRREGPTVLLVNDQRGVILGAVGARSSRVPLVWQVHSAEQSGVLRRLGSLAASAVVAPSRATAARMPSRSVHVVPNGVRAPAPAPPAADGAAASLLTVGRLHPDKDLGTLLEAFARLRAQHPQLTLSIIGAVQRGHERYAEELRDHARRLGVQPAVTFLDGDVAPFAGADQRTIYVQSSARETFGLALAEAMAAGLAVVATATDGAADLVADGRTGLIVPPHAPAALADAADRLLRDEELARALADAAREDVLRRFTTDRMLAAEAAVLEGVVTRR